MASSLDLLILPLARTGGQEQASVPGLHVAAPPKRPARFRNRDRLALHLVLTGTAPLSPEQVNALVENLAKTFYSTPGTVTTAQRAIAEALNQYLLDRNLRNASTGQQVTGHLTQIVFREDRLSIAQSGISHAYLLTESGFDHVHDPALAGNGLGMNRTTPIHFTQINLKANDAAVIAVDPPLVWTKETLMSPRGQGPESLRRRLLSAADGELNAFLVQAQPGSGQLRLLRPVKVAVPPTASARPPAIEAAPETSMRPHAAGTPITAEIMPGAESTADDYAPALERKAAGMEQVSGAARQDRRPQSPAGVRRQADRTAAPPVITSWFGKAGMTTRNTTRRVLLGIGEVARRILPDSSLFTIPSSTMALMAIGVPLVVVTIAALVFFQRGRKEQFDLYFVQAQAAAAEAGAKTDPRELRQAWGTTLAHLEQAESFLVTEESRQLREQAQVVLDRLDVIERLDYKPAIVGGLPEKASIIRLVAVEDDLFLLNSTDGIVLHALFTSEGYRLDPTFQCGPGPVGGFIVGSLIDIAPAPEEDALNASLLGIDASGNLLKCFVGESPVATPLQPPDISWGAPRAITVDGNNLVVLDPQTSAAWMYQEMNLNEAPRQFFDEQIPRIQDAIDLAAFQGDLYMLHSDGHLTTCSFGAVSASPTRCQEQAVFTDPRAGRQSGPLLEDATFSEIKLSPPPEPAVYLLDPNTKSIYQFSVRLTYDRQFRPRNPLAEAPVTAFAVEKSNRIAFLAVEDQVFYAAMP
jgi:hypothetical protein